jgi:hypothetical protein
MATSKLRQVNPRRGQTRPEKIAGQVGHTGHPMARFGRSSLLTRVPQNAQMFRRKRSIPTAGNLTRTAFRCPELRVHRRERCFGHPRRDMGLLNPLELEHRPSAVVDQSTPNLIDDRRRPQLGSDLAISAMMTKIGFRHAQPSRCLYRFGHLVLTQEIGKVSLENHWLLPVDISLAAHR